MNVGAIYVIIVAAVAIATTVTAGVKTRSAVVTIIYGLYAAAIWALFVFAVISKC